MIGSLSMSNGVLSNFASTLASIFLCPSGCATVVSPGIGTSAALSLFTKGLRAAGLSAGSTLLVAAFDLVLRVTGCVAVGVFVRAEALVADFCLLANVAMSTGTVEVRHALVT
jgi:hypothetical protein